MDFQPRPVLSARSPHEGMYLLAALSAGLGLRILTFLSAPAIELDGIGYATVAARFAKGLFGQALSDVFPPVYPLAVAFFHLFIPDFELAGRSVSLVCGMLAIYVSFLFAKRLYPQGAKPVWIAFLVAFQPYLVRYSGAVLSESLAVLLFSAAFFAFYAGWRDERRGRIAASGLCLTLTYLARPEYIAFYAPFLFLLLTKRRFRDSLLFLSPFLVLGVLYICALRWQTGLWMVSGKATLSPFVRLGAAFGNAPLVAYEFLVALFPVFFVLALFGVRKVEKPYRNLVFLLAACHVASLSFVSHATRRYSVEFVPVSMPFVVEGLYAAENGLRRFFRTPAVSSRLLPAVRAAMVALIVASAVFQSYVPPHEGRALHKKAGLFLRRYDPGSIVASRLPLVAFYEKGESVDLLSGMSQEKDLEHFKRLVAEKKAAYLVFDEELDEELPFLRSYLSRLAPVFAASGPGVFLKVYRL